MINLSYTLTDPAVLAGLEQQDDVSTAARADLLWSGFPGDVGILSADGEISTDFEWVPLLHFASSMVSVVDQLTEPGTLAGYIFTESDDELRFERGRELVRISATFTDTALTTTIPELSDAVRRFILGLLDDLIDRHPGFAQNPVAGELRTAVAQRS
jgi:hypothetical protein